MSAGKVMPSLAAYQLRRFIEKGLFVPECKAEWKRRFGVDYPHIKMPDESQVYGNDCPNGACNI